MLRGSGPAMANVSRWRLFARLYYASSERAPADALEAYKADETTDQQPNCGRLGSWGQLDGCHIRKRGAHFDAVDRSGESGVR